jgi:hypothetical protein
MKKQWVNDYYKIQVRYQGEKRWYCTYHQLATLAGAKRLAKQYLKDVKGMERGVKMRVRYYHPHYIKARTVWKSY